MEVFKLTYDYIRIDDSLKDAYHIPFEHSNKSSSMFLNKKYIGRLPKLIYFESNFNTIPKTDFPLNDLNIPIMSDRLIKLILSTGRINFKSVPVIMLDDTYLEKKFDDSGLLFKNVKRIDSYQAIMLLDRINCFDYEKSIYESSELNPKIPGYIKKVVLKISGLSLPPIFRINESPSTLFISDNLKNIMVENKIMGCEFEKIETT